ncbi:hypothetical protein J8L88_21005 [Aquimarina sp. MMG015]|uniref:hypothetical protein n=1 Tax=Aquimarina TaxID=290174 RepID=UPI0003F7A6EE|nr:MULTISPECIES: hypothetical protein [Aquimarina]AXT55911.1 hypothetical protein D1815_09160 [Aquimarina sp. AD1]MBQ4805354.1 hypothetical protein [Aquimarina sp. MMG015]RKN19538.1 hypothetical protein D7035_13605 [Aquimarina sp. AD1]
MKVNELITEAITEFLDVEVNGDTGNLNFASKIEIVKKRISDKVKSSPESYGVNDLEAYEYEMFFSSNPNDMIKIDGWLPIDTKKIEKADKIREYIEIGLLRRIEKAA